MAAAKLNKTLFALVLGLLCLPSVVFGQLLWDNAFEATPAMSELASTTPARLQDIKGEVRTRLETELDFGDQNAVGLDTGRLQIGSSRIFIHATDCTVVVGIVEADFDGNVDLDNGRLCWEADDADLYIFAGATTDDPPTGGAWVIMVDGATQTGVGVDSGMIVLREDGTACATGWTDVTTTSGYEGVTVRGADLSVGIAGIPDTAGIDCPGGAGCSGTAEEYNDTIVVAEMPSHGHPWRDGHAVGSGHQGAAAGGLGRVSTPTSHAAFAGTVSSADAEAIGGTGGGGDNFHPLRTVRFCKKD